MHEVVIELGPLTAFHVRRNHVHAEACKQDVKPSRTNRAVQLLVRDEVNQLGLGESFDDLARGHLEGDGQVVLSYEFWPSLKSALASATFFPNSRSMPLSFCASMNRPFTVPDDLRLRMRAPSLTSGKIRVSVSGSNST